MSDNKGQANALQRVLHARFSENIDVPADLAGVEQLLKIASATSHRAWAPQPVSDGIVKVLAACSLSAPSKSYLQQSDIIHIRDCDKRNAIGAIVPEMPWMAQAPVFLVFCANGHRFARIFEQREQAFTNDHLDAFFNATVDASLVMMNFINAASAAGLVCCPISMIRNEPQTLAEILELPDRVIPVAGLCVGYPSAELLVNPRLPLRATFHTDAFDSARQDEAIDDFDARYRDARTAIAARAGTLNARQPQRWSDERVKQYNTAQRSNWGRFVRFKKFNLS